jgi:hypothetical protein
MGVSVFFDSLNNLKSCLLPFENAVQMICCSSYLQQSNCSVGAVFFMNKSAFVFFAFPQVKKLEENQDSLALVKPSICYSGSTFKKSNC